MSDLSPLEEVLPEMMTDLLSHETEEMWDFPPVLYIVCEPHPDYPGRWTVMPALDMSKALIGSNDVPGRLFAIGAALMIPFSPPPPFDPMGLNIVGLMFRNEGWGLIGQAAGKVTPEEAQAWVEEGNRIVDHPAAREFRMITGITEDSMSMAYQVRHGDVEILEDTTAFEGRVPDALRLVLRGMQMRFNS